MAQYGGHCQRPDLYPPDGTSARHALLPGNTIRPGSTVLASAAAMASLEVAVAKCVGVILPERSSNSWSASCSHTRTVSFQHSNTQTVVSNHSVASQRCSMVTKASCSIIFGRELQHAVRLWHRRPGEHLLSRFRHPTAASWCARSIPNQGASPSL